MSRLNVAPTKANRLLLRRQLEFAVEGYDLLEQKRQILVQEWLRRMADLRAAEARLELLLARAHGAMREAVLDAGSAALDRAALGCADAASVEVRVRHLMGVRLPGVTVDGGPGGAAWGTAEASVQADVARRRFLEVLTCLGEVGAMQTAVLRLGRELRRTQRRCNALSRIFIPAYRETLSWLGATLEERDREFLVMLKRVKRLGSGAKG